jgi:hypothetical protein
MIFIVELYHLDPPPLGFHWKVKIKVGSSDIQNLYPATMVFIFNSGKKDNFEYLI